MPEVTLDEATGEFVCTRTSADPLQTMIQDTVPPGPGRTSLRTAIWDRVRRVAQVAALSDRTAWYAARDFQTQRNISRIVTGGMDGGASLELALAGIMEAAGAVSGRHFTRHEVLDISLKMVRHCQTAITSDECVSAIVGSVSPKHVEKLKLVGFRL